MGGKHKEDNCQVYKVVNKLNGKTYVGISNDPEKRLRHHVWEETLLGLAITEYGRENFDFEILFSGMRSECATKEIEYVSEFNCIDNGYNRHKGGGEPPHASGKDHYNYGKTRSKETIDKIKSARAKQKPHENQREAMRKRMSDPLRNPKSRAKLERLGLLPEQQNRL